MKILLQNIKELVQVEEQTRQFVAGKEMANLNTITDAWLLIDGDKILDFGKMSEVDKVENLLGDDSELTELDVDGRMVFPAFCDSHTHLVYAGSREIEYNDKIKGLSYEEIAKRGGGILTLQKEWQKQPKRSFLKVLCNVF